MHERRFNGDVSLLRSKERLAWLEVDRVVKLSLQDFSPSRVLDVGTGSGIFAEAFAKSGLEVLGVDANTEMLKKAREFVPNAIFKEGVAESLPFPDASFDLVFLGLLLHETDDRLKAFQEAKRVTRQRISVLEWPYIVQDKGPGLDIRLSESDIQSLANQVGLKNLQVFPLQSLVLYLLE